MPVQGLGLGVEGCGSRFRGKGGLKVLRVRYQGCPEAPMWFLPKCTPQLFTRVNATASPTRTAWESLVGLELRRVCSSGF